MVVRIAAQIISVVLALQVFLVATQATDSGLELGTQEYITQNQRHYNAIISSYDQQLKEFSAVYRSRVAIIDVHSMLIQSQLDDADYKLEASEALSPLSKNCVQKYRSKIFAKASVKTILNACINTANNALHNLLSQPTSTKATLERYHESTLPYNLNNCYRTFLPTNPKYTECILENIQDANIYTKKNQNIFAENMREASCNGDARIKIALDCSSKQLYGAIGSIHGTMLLVDMCVESSGAACVGDNKSVDCGKSIDLEITPADFRSTTIKNLFYGMSSTSECVQVNFLKV